MNKGLIQQKIKSKSGESPFKISYRPISVALPSYNSNFVATASNSVLRRENAA